MVKYTKEILSQLKQQKKEKEKKTRLILFHTSHLFGLKIKN